VRKKDKEKEFSIELRRQGKSIDQIVHLVGASQGSVSAWVRDVKLTEEQKRALAHRSVKHLIKGRKKGVVSKRRAKMGEAAWEIYQKNRQAKAALVNKETHNSLWWRHKRRELKEKLVRYKGGKCVLCGYNKYLSALEFHHKDPLKKEFTISSYNSINFEKVRKEVDKCELLCNRCHTEIHEDIEIKKRINIFQKGGIPCGEPEKPSEQVW